MEASKIHVGATEGERADFAALGTRYIVRSEQTDGRFALIEHTIPPRGLAAPVHTHANEDEYSYVLSGRLGAVVGDDVVEAGPGELVAKRRGIPHAFWNAGDREVRLLELITPGGFEQYFADIAPVLAGDGPPETSRRWVRSSLADEITMDPESIGPLSERFGLRPQSPCEHPCQRGPSPDGPRRRHPRRQLQRDQREFRIRVEGGISAEPARSWVGRTARAPATADRVALPHGCESELRACEDC